MTYVNETCNICNKTFKDHSGNIGYILREHIKEEHQELFKEIEVLEKELQTLRTKLQAKAKECNWNVKCWY